MAIRHLLHQSAWLNQRKKSGQIILASQGTTATHTAAKIAAQTQNTITQLIKKHSAHLALKHTTELLQGTS